MYKYLFVLFSFFITFSLSAQYDDDFEVGTDSEEKKITIITNDKTASIFLDGVLVGSDKAKVKLDSRQANLLVVTYANGEVTIENLSVQTTPEEYTVVGRAVQQPKKQNRAYFDSLFIETHYDLEEGKFIGWNEKVELYWRDNTKTLFTGNDRHFSDHMSDYLTLYGMPSGNFGYDTAVFDYQLLFY